MIDPGEEWRVVPGHADYEVSSLGRVRSWKRGYGALLKCAPDSAGYPRVVLDSASRYNVHRLVAAAFIGPCPEGKEVDHVNTVRADNRAENLQYLTRRENMAKLQRVLKLRCSRDHPMAGDNVYVRPNGQRECRACTRYMNENRAPSGIPCSVDGCDRMATNGFRTEFPVCEMDYQRQRRATG